MGLYDSASPELTNLHGLHLYHFALSNCSQRVRLALEEKGLPWTSHHRNLPGNEHCTPGYLAINPKGVVPTLVHDGQVVIESNDILQYVEERFPEPPLQPSDLDARRSMGERIQQATAIQGAIKVLSHELLFRAFRKIGPEDVAFFERSHPDRDLVDFVRAYSESGEEWERRVEAARGSMETDLEILEDTLGRQPWLSGQDYGLADISWVVNAHRLTQCRYPLEDRTRFSAWYEKAASRPAFDRAIGSYQP